MFINYSGFSDAMDNDVGDTVKLIDRNIIAFARETFMTNFYGSG